MELRWRKVEQIADEGSEVAEVGKAVRSVSEKTAEKLLRPKLDRKACQEFFLKNKSIYKRVVFG